MDEKRDRSRTFNYDENDLSNLLFENKNKEKINIPKNNPLQCFENYEINTNIMKNKY